MRALGEEIFRAHDEWGAIVVYQDGERRILAFGNQVEQSCVSLHYPARLEYVYTQAMILPLLFAGVPRRALLLGLGGGSLARALRAQAPKCRVHAVEHRAAVAAIAQQYFFLETDERLTVFIEDAGAYLAVNRVLYDLLLLDLYQAEGMDRQQAQREMLMHCREALTPDGVLVVNLWSSEYQPETRIGAMIRDVFDERVLLLHVQGGNIIVFAFKGTLPLLSRRPFFEAAQALGYRMDIPLQKLARNLWRQNSEILQLDRYRAR
jgi:spermidine synthase